MFKLLHTLHHHFRSARHWSGYRATPSRRWFHNTLDRLGGLDFAGQHAGLVRVAILGPPNAGKSTLFNRLLDKESNKTYRLSIDKKKNKGARSSRRSSSANKGRFAADAHHAAGSAIVSDVPGTTRDRREGVAKVGGTYFWMMDTAGIDGERLDHFLDPKPLRDHDEKNNNNNNNKSKKSTTTATTTTAALARPMMRQALLAAQQAHLILLMFDARVGVTADFLETCRWLRKYGAVRDTSDTSENDRNENGDADNHHHPQRVMVLANKLEGDSWTDADSPVQDHLTEAARAGFGSVTPISAIHGDGMADIAVAVGELHDILFSDEETDDDDTDGMNHDEKPLSLAILGRINVGKSTLVNALLQRERVIAGPTPGLTRDAIRIPWTWQGRNVQLVDTAGLRKRPQRDHSNNIEDMAVQDAMHALKVADVAVLVLDAQAGLLQRHELAIANVIVREGRAMVVAANKMDLVVEEDHGYTKEDFARDVRKQIEERFPMLRKTPIIPISSLHGDVDGLMPAVFDARDRWARTIPTAQLNRWLSEVVDAHSPPPVRGIATRFKYIIQTKGRPPTFLLFSNTGELAESYVRYLTRNFQDTFQMFGMEVRILTKKSATDNPYEPSKKRGGSGIGGRKVRHERAWKLMRENNTSKPERRKPRRRK